MSDHEGGFGEDTYMDGGDEFDQDLVEEQQDDANFNALDDQHNVVESGQPMDDGEGGRAVPKDQRSTTPYMTKYERARILGTRALQIRCVSDCSSTELGRHPVRGPMILASRTLGWLPYAGEAERRGA